MSPHLSFSSYLLLLALAGGLSQPAPALAAASTTVAEAGIDWLVASRDEHVDAAFARAKAENKPLFLYWGAKWCPPCNHVKATLFKRQEFIARSRAFIPVYVDGDIAGSQKLGERFKVRGYPTMVLFTSDGTELIRLPGEVGALQYTEVLSLGMAARRPIKAVVADARDARRSASLDAAEWRMLAFYSWGTDEQQLVPKAEVEPMLKQLAANCPDKYRDTSDRLLLQSLAVTEATVSVAAKTQQRVLRLLDESGRTRAQMDILGNEAPAIVKAMSAAGTPQRIQLLASFDAALERLAADATLSRADRMTAQIARVALARIDLDKGAKPALSAQMLQAVRKQVARDDREITDGYERQAVITSAAYLLVQAGLDQESDKLLKANLPKSHSPYYLMSALASNAKARGDKAEALRWFAQAHERSEGSATRLQWGASHLAALVELAPADGVTIEKVANQIFSETSGKADAFYERSARSLQRVSNNLLTWADSAPESSRADAVLARLQAQLDGICRGLPATDAARGVCQRLLKPASSASSGKAT